MRPGYPYIEFITLPSVSILLDNPIQGSGFFTIKSDLSSGDTVSLLQKRICQILGLIGKFYIYAHWTNK